MEYIACPGCREREDKLIAERRSAAADHGAVETLRPENRALRERVAVLAEKVLELRQTERDLQAKVQTLESRLSMWKEWTEAEQRGEAWDVPVVEAAVELQET